MGLDIKPRTSAEGSLCAELDLSAIQQEHEKQIARLQAENHDLRTQLAEVITDRDGWRQAFDCACDDIEQLRSSITNT